MFRKYYVWHRRNWKSVIKIGKLFRKCFSCDCGQSPWFKNRSPRPSFSLIVFFNHPNYHSSSQFIDSADLIPRTLTKTISPKNREKKPIAIRKIEKKSHIRKKLCLWSWCIAFLVNWDSFPQKFVSDSASYPCQTKDISVGNISSYNWY